MRLAPVAGPFSVWGQMGRYKAFKRDGLSREQNNYYVARKRMLDEQIISRGVRDDRVLKAVGEIPRHLFVPEALHDQAYKDHPLNIGEGQTISQPLIVAMMTEALELTGSERVLEIGTGSGYQAAILSLLCKHVYTIERIRALANRARRMLYDIGITNFTLRVGDGTMGWPDEARFDGILVTAGAPSVPSEYCDQLSEGGRLIIPVGDEVTQQLVVARKVDGKLVERVVTGCRFVKLIGKHGWQNRK